jgi:hypothetical protein
MSLKRNLCSTTSVQLNAVKAPRGLPNPILSCNLPSTSLPHSIAFHLFMDDTEDELAAAVGRKKKSDPPLAHVMRSEMVQLLRSFLRGGRLTFRDFKGFWSARNMSLLHLSLDSSLSPALSVEQAFREALTLLADPVQLRTMDGEIAPEYDPGCLGSQIGALYILYCLYETQTNRPKVPVRVDPYHLAGLIAFGKRLKRAGTKGAEPRALLKRMSLSSDFFQPSVYTGPGHYKFAVDVKQSMAFLATGKPLGLPHEPEKADRDLLAQKKAINGCCLKQEYLQLLAKPVLRDSMGKQHEKVLKPAIHGLMCSLKSDLCESDLLMNYEKGGMGSKRELSSLCDDLDLIQSSFSAGRDISDAFDLKSYANRHLECEPPLARPFWPSLKESGTTVPPVQLSTAAIRTTSPPRAVRAHIRSQSPTFSASQMAAAGTDSEFPVVSVEQSGERMHIASATVRHLLKRSQAQAPMAGRGQRGQPKPVRGRSHLGTASLSRPGAVARGNILAGRRMPSASASVVRGDPQFDPLSATERPAGQRASESSVAEPPLRGNILARSSPSLMTSSSNGNILARKRSSAQLGHTLSDDKSTGEGSSLSSALGAPAPGGNILARRPHNKKARTNSAPARPANAPEKESGS